MSMISNCSQYRYWTPASKVESIAPTLAGLVEVGLVFQQLNHTLQTRKQLACESTALHGHMHYGMQNLISTTKNPFTSKCGCEEEVERSLLHVLVMEERKGCGGCLPATLTFLSQEACPVRCVRRNGFDSHASPRTL